MQFKRAILNPAPNANLPLPGSSQGRLAFFSGLLVTASILAFQPIALAQGSPVPGSSPLPGDNNAYDRSAPASFGDGARNSAPLPGGTRPDSALQTNALPGRNPQAHGAPQSVYQQLPLSAEEARIRLEDLSNRLAVSRPDDVKESIYALSEWLQDVADAHWRMFKAFEKSDTTKIHAAKEKDVALKFSSLKNRAKLLKADLFIKQNRYPEALGPLVEIVTTEPTTATGQEAYKRLVDMGFSEQVTNVELAEKGINHKR